MEKNPKKPQKYECKNCAYGSSNKKDYSRHLLTPKHASQSGGYEMVIKNPKKPQNQIYGCECGKEYKHLSGLWRHKKVCIAPNSTTTGIQQSPDEIKNLTTMVLELMKSNNELQKQMIDVCKNTSNTTINSHNNSNNKTFNLQFFLNEQCKDAMNISDFVNSFDLQLTDLESVGDLGYVEGMTKIFLDKLNSMDIYKRPIHCSDVKREILYIKDEDKWEKELRSNPKLRYAIKTLSFKNMKLANLWSDTYPESKNNESHLNDVYMKLIIQSTGGSGEICDSENKIIKRIAKEIFIDKNSISQ